MRAVSYGIGYQGETQILTQLRFIQWMDGALRMKCNRAFIISMACLPNYA
jgi:hypothetical protein